ncbi:unnamed protein product, partial [Prorocentrum cordatum]
MAAAPAGMVDIHPLADDVIQALAEVADLNEVKMIFDQLFSRIRVAAKYEGSTPVSLKALLISALVRKQITAQAFINVLVAADLAASNIRSVGASTLSNKTKGTGKLAAALGQNATTTCRFVDKDATRNSIAGRGPDLEFTAAVNAPSGSRTVRGTGVTHFEQAGATVLDSGDFDQKQDRIAGWGKKTMRKNLAKRKMDKKETAQELEEWEEEQKDLATAVQEGREQSRKEKTMIVAVPEDVASDLNSAGFKIFVLKGATSKTLGEAILEYDKDFAKKHPGLASMFGDGSMNTAAYDFLKAEGLLVTGDAPPEAEQEGEPASPAIVEIVNFATKYLPPELAAPLSQFTVSDNKEAVDIVSAWIQDYSVDLTIEGSSQAQKQLANVVATLSSSHEAIRADTARIAATALKDAVKEITTLPYLKGTSFSDNIWRADYIFAAFSAAAVYVGEEMKSAANTKKVIVVHTATPKAHLTYALALGGRMSAASFGQRKDSMKPSLLFFISAAARISNDHRDLMKTLQITAGGEVDDTVGVVAVIATTRNVTLAPVRLGSERAAEAKSSMGIGSE